MKKKKSKTITVKPNSYQPSKAELEEKVHIHATPEHLGKIITKKRKLHFKD